MNAGSLRECAAVRRGGLRFSEQKPEDKTEKTGKYKANV